MTTLTINVPDKATEEIVEAIQRFGGEIVVIKETTREVSPIEEPEQGLNEVAAIRERKLPKLSLNRALRS